MNTYMEIAKNNSLNGSKNNEGGPFGAVIVDKNGNIISEGNNKVICSSDPTAHAEIVAIRNACQKLRTYDLSDYILYTSCEPCPMCLSAIIWANIKTVYYGSNRQDAKAAGFKDDDIYQYLAGKNQLLEKQELENKSCKDLFINYNGERY